MTRRREPFHVGQRLMWRSAEGFGFLAPVEVVVTGVRGPFVDVVARRTDGTVIFFTVTTTQLSLPEPKGGDAA